MTLSRSRRWAARLLLPLSLLIAAEPLRALDCASHMAVAATIDVTASHMGPAAAANSAATHVEEAAALRTHSHHQAPTAGAPDAAGHSDPVVHTGENAQQHAHQCDCIGSCSTVAALRIEAFSVVPATVIGHRAPTLPVELDAAPAVRPERLLPFANGPPTPA